jgi:hypothetical protein
MNRYIYITIVVLIGGIAQAFAESLPLLPDHQLTPGVAGAANGCPGFQYSGLERDIAIFNPHLDAISVEFYFVQPAIG